MLVISLSWDIKRDIPKPNKWNGINVKILICGHLKSTKWLTLRMIPIRLASDVKGKICMIVKLITLPESVLSFIDELDLSMRANPIFVVHSTRAISSGLAACKECLKISASIQCYHYF